jgi:decaprenylphospho-beta-D-ribofuranose 2-oxidase
MKQDVSNWGNTPTIYASLIPFNHLHQLKEVIHHTQNVIPRGMGRCYGDSALNDTIISTTEFNQMKSFDASTGIVICQAGITLEAILNTIIPSGWFLPVTPGTKFVTIGGVVAANVHGKNHHVHGSLSQHLMYIDVLTSEDTIIRCSPNEQSDLFYMTCGGMGLTGIIVEVAIQLIPISSSYIRQKTMRAKNLETIMDYFEVSHDWTYSVAWIDCLATGSSLGRSVLMLGEHATCNELSHRQSKQPLQLSSKRKKSIPYFLPNWALNSWTVRLFNMAYFHASPKTESTQIIDYDSFFYPLDHIHHWNKCYGKRGFTQYQCVFPLHSSKDGLTQLLHKISDSGQGSFLAVLKRFGKESLPGLSFPMEGYTLALDFPMTPSTCQLMNELDTIVEKYNGRLYLAKDSRMSASFFKSTYKNYDSFISHKNNIDTKHQFQSMQSRRLSINP